MITIINNDVNVDHVNDIYNKENEYSFLYYVIIIGLNVELFMIQFNVYELYYCIA